MFLRTDVNKASEPTIGSDFYFSCNHQFLFTFISQKINHKNLPRQRTCFKNYASRIEVKLILVFL